MVLQLHCDLQLALLPHRGCCDSPAGAAAQGSAAALPAVQALHHSCCCVVAGDCRLHRCCCNCVSASSTALPAFLQVGMQLGGDGSSWASRGESLKPRWHSRVSRGQRSGTAKVPCEQCVHGMNLEITRACVGQCERVWAVGTSLCVFSRCASVDVAFTGSVALSKQQALGCAKVCTMHLHKGGSLRTAHQHIS